MKVVCDNCRSAYRVPDEKLQKPINKAVCRGCGFRLMIPRPKPGHDPDQRVLVSAVPPKKPGAPPKTRQPEDRSNPGRSDSGRGRPPSSIRQPVQSLQIDPGTGTSFAPASKLDPETAPIPEDRMGAMATSAALAPDLESAASPETPTAVRAPTPRSPSHPSLSKVHQPAHPSPRQPSQPSLPSRRGPPSVVPAPRRPSQPSLAQDRRSVAPPGARVAGPGSVPGTPPRSAAAHNPAMDYIWTLVGLGMAGVGLLTGLATVIVDHPVVVFAASALFIGGSLLALLVTVTGRQGKRPARIFSSLTTSGTIATLVGLSIVSTRFALDSNHIWARTPPPLPPPTPAEEAETPTTRNPTGLPVEAVQKLVENNLGVKRCFVPFFVSSTLPSRVDVAFTIAPAGDASDISVVRPERFSGSKLEKCLVKAIAGIQFPVSTGKGTSFVYPLIIR